MIPCSTPTSTTTPAVVAASRNSPGLSRRIAWSPAQVHQPDGHNKHNCAQNAFREVLQRLGQEEQHQRDHRRRGNVRHLAPATGAFHHGGLRGTSVHHKRAAERRRRIRRGQAYQVRVLVQRLMVPRGVNAGGGRALRDDHHKTRSRNGNQQLQLVPAHGAGPDAAGRRPPAR